jgi:hypothetical protein
MDLIDILIQQEIVDIGHIKKTRIYVSFVNLKRPASLIT